MQDQLRETCRRLLAEDTVKVVIGYGQAGGDCPDFRGDCPDFRLSENGTVPLSPTYPVFITRAEDVTQLVWNDRCLANLTVYLSTKEIRDLGKPAIVVKGCDERALLVLEKESQIDRSQIVVIGMACDGAEHPQQPKCAACDVAIPRRADTLISPRPATMYSWSPGEGPGVGASGSAIGIWFGAGLPTPPAGSSSRYAELDAFLQKPIAERMAFWQEELSRCVKCYACRQVCPLCYCPRCIVDKNRPVVISPSATLKGNFAWHLTRAFHLAGRCVGCDECTRACPVGIDLRLLNQSLAKAAEDNFAFRAGMDPEAEPIVGAYSDRDREDFIR